MAIRSVRENDFVECIAVTHRAWPEFKEREAIYHLLTRFFADTSFVSEEGGAIRGFLLGFISQVDRRDAYIHLIVTDPASQRRGVARGLYQEFFRKARALGCQSVRLTVSPDNEASLAFHRRLGFRPEIRGESVWVGSVLAQKDFNGPGNAMVPFMCIL